MPPQADSFSPSQTVQVSEEGTSGPRPADQGVLTPAPQFWEALEEILWHQASKQTHTQTKQHEKPHTKKFPLANMFLSRPKV